MSIPKQGDIYQIDLPELGSDRRGNVLVLSVTRYNTSQLIVAVPVLPKSYNILIEKPVIELDQKHIILSDQLKTVNYQNRKPRYVGTVPGEILLKVLGLVSQILGIR